MAYKLLPSQDDNKLFFRLEGEAAERYGVIGYMRADFGNDGREFWTTWFDGQSHLKTYDFKKELEDVVNSLRDDGQEPPFASRNNLAAFCAVNPGKELNSRGCGYMVRTQDYSYYFRCLPRPGDYDMYCFAYDNRYLLPELAGQHELPEYCYSTLPDTGAVITIKQGESGYYPCDYTTNNRQFNAMTITEDFEEVTLFDKPALFTHLRIDRATVPRGYYAYDIRHDDDDCQGEAVQIACNIFVNHWGTVITRDEVKLPLDGYRDMRGEDINYACGDCDCMKMFMEKYPPKIKPLKEHER